MSETREHVNGWCCVDCLVLLANGDEPDGWSQVELDDWHRRIDDCTAGSEVTLGRMFGEDGCEHTGWHSGEESEDHAESCERVTFSRWPCDVCGSPLAGSRDAVTFRPVALAFAQRHQVEAYV